MASRSSLRPPCPRAAVRFRFRWVLDATEMGDLLPLAKLPYVTGSEPKSETGEPHVGEEGYLGLDVVRAARISAAGHGGQILISETTRALLGNQLPEGVAVHDLGQQHLKDVQHEHIYELTIDGRSLAGKPLKTAKPKSSQEDMASRMEERINTYVEGRIESAMERLLEKRQRE